MSAEWVRGAVMVMRVCHTCWTFWWGHSDVACPGKTPGFAPEWQLPKEILNKDIRRKKNLNELGSGNIDNGLRNWRIYFGHVEDIIKQDSFSCSLVLPLEKLAWKHDLLGSACSWVYEINQFLMTVLPKYFSFQYYSKTAKQGCQTFENWVALISLQPMI